MQISNAVRQRWAAILEQIAWLRDGEDNHFKAQCRLEAKQLKELLQYGIPDFQRKATPAEAVELAQKIHEEGCIEEIQLTLDRQALAEGRFPLLVVEGQRRLRAFVHNGTAKVVSLTQFMGPVNADFQTARLWFDRLNSKKKVSPDHKAYYSDQFYYQVAREVNQDASHPLHNKVYFGEMYSPQQQATECIRGGTFKSLMEAVVRNVHVRGKKRPKLGDTRVREQFRDYSYFIGHVFNHLSTPLSWSNNVGYILAAFHARHVYYNRCPLRFDYQNPLHVYALTRVLEKKSIRDVSHRKHIPQLTQMVLREWGKHMTLSRKYLVA